ncbi:hypothetical protein evm_003997 [Chilo suppressalis]|nr:hypothetical protein evm_003997 [Chilo suppressalis]
MVAVRDDSTVHAGYLGQAAAGQAVTKEKRENLVIKLNQALDHISEWGTKNLVEFNAKKTQVCAFTAKTSPFLSCPSLQGTTLELESSITMLGMEIRCDLNPKNYIESVIKTTSHKLGILNKVRHFFTLVQLCLLYKMQVQSCVEYCSQLWDFSAKYLLDALDRLQLPAIRVMTIRRLRLGHVNTPVFLAKLRIRDNSLCECGLEDGTVEHIFFRCLNIQNLNSTR